MTEPSLTFTVQMIVVALCSRAMQFQPFNLILEFIGARATIGDWKFSIYFAVVETILEKKKVNIFWVIPACVYKSTRIN